MYCGALLVLSVSELLETSVGEKRREILGVLYYQTSPGHGTDSCVVAWGLATSAVIFFADTASSTILLEPFLALQ